MHFFGISAALLTTLAIIPQTYKIIKDKNTEGISTHTCTMLLLGTLFWVIYRITNSDLSILLANGITALTCTIILTLNFASPKVIKKVREKVLPEQVKSKYVSRNLSANLWLLVIINKINNKYYYHEKNYF